MGLLQLELGTANPLFLDDYATFESLATNCWLKHVWRFQQEFELSLKHATPCPCSSTKERFLLNAIILC
jgi:hypothetical protein